MVAKKAAIRRLVPAGVDSTGAKSRDAQMISEYLSRDPLHNIYLIHALTWMLAAPAASSSEQSIEMSNFWGAFVAESSAPCERASIQECATVSDHENLAGLLLSESQDRPGSGRRQSTHVGYLANLPRAAGRPERTPNLAGCYIQHDEILACLGRFAARSGIRTLIGHRSTVEPALAGLESEWQVQARLLHFYQADPERLVRSYDHPVRQATEEDIPELIELYRGYEFSRRDTMDDEIRRGIEQAMSQSGVYYCVDAPDAPDCANSTNSTIGHPERGEGSPRRRIVSAARVYPETDTAGLIGAARTLPEFRGQGIYPAIRTACFEHLFSQGKAGLGMFLDTNTSMHRIIGKQGGTILAEWLIADLQFKPRRALVRLRRRLVPSQIRKWAIRLLRH